MKGRKRAKPAPANQPPASDLLWRRMFDAVGDAVMLLGPDLKIRLLNRAAERLLKASPGAVLGRPCHEVVHGSSHCADACPTGRMIASRRREESEVPVGDRWYHVVSDPLLDGAGRVAGVVHVMSDATEQRRAEQALRQSQKSLSEAQRIARLGSWDWDIAGHALAWSDEVYRIFGLAPAAFGATYEAFLERVHPEDRPSVTAAVDRALADPSYRYGVEHRVVRPDGDLRVVRERGEVFRGPDGRPVRMIGTVHDVTEQRRAEEEAARLREDLFRLERLSRMGELTASVAHELNQPLAAILGNAQAALRFLDAGRADPGEMKEILRDVASDCKRAGEVIRGLRAMVKQEARPKELLDLNRVLGEVVTLVRSEMIARNVSLETAFQEPLPQVPGDRVQVQQVLLNLVLNAADAVAENPPGRRRVEVRTAPAEGVVRMSVLDSGPGIPEGALEMLFKPFFTTKPGGMGMGLAVSRTIVEHHGGRIRAENRPGGGAAFHVELPAPASK